MEESIERFVILAIILASGCTSWERLAEMQPVPDKGPVQVWSGGRADTLQRLQVMGDSIVGRRLLPDTTRLAMSRMSVDSLRVERADPGKVFIVATGAGLVLFLVYMGGLQGLGS